MLEVQINQAISLIDPVMRLLIPNEFATIVTEIVLKSLAPFGYQTAHSTDPPLRSAKASPRLILFAFGIVGAHDVRKYISSVRFSVRVCGSTPRERIVDVNSDYTQNPLTVVNECNGDFHQLRWLSAGWRFR